MNLVVSFMKTIKQPFNRVGLLTYIYKTLNPHVVCEVGVKQGIYSKHMLENIPSIEKLYLIDLWKQQNNYVDSSNVSDNVHAKHYNQTLQNTKDWEDRVILLRGYTNEMCHNIPDGSLDWVYIDARHDYKGASEDIENFYPKLKDTGIMSGHDYLTSEEVKNITPSQDWSICCDGSIEPRAVKGAVNDLALKVNKDIYVTNDRWPSWSIHK
jgi:hypothetical protein